MSAYMFLIVMGLFLGASWLLRLIVSEKMGRKTDRLE